MSHIGTHLEFCEMSPTYVGYRPREKSEDLIVGREKFKRATAAALKIQAVHRGRKTRMDILREKQEKEELEAAALKIQAVHRGRKTRMDLLNSGWRLGCVKAALFLLWFTYL